MYNLDTDEGMEAFVREAADAILAMRKGQPVNASAGYRTTSVMKVGDNMFRDGTVEKMAQLMELYSQPVNASAPSSVSFNDYNPGNDPEHKANLIRDELRAGTMTPARATALLEDGGFTMKQIEDLFTEAGKH